MRLILCSLALASTAVLAAPARAQIDGVMQSAETINQGNFKLMLSPMYAFGEAGADDEIGLAGRFGYGFTDRFDAEAKASFFENQTFIGGDLEVWLLKDSGLDFSLIGGAHYNMVSNNGLDTWGLDVAPLLSGHLTDSVEPYVALDVAFENVIDAPPLADDTYNTAHLVPGFEIRASEDADFLVEFGVGLNDHSSEYMSAGVAFYLR